MELRSLLKVLVLIAACGCIEAGMYTPLMRAQKSKLAQYNSFKINQTSTTTTTQKQLSVMGGMAANPGQFPSVVYIYIVGEYGDYFCSGTLIYYNYVVTSGLCLLGAHEVDIILGEFDLSAMYPNTRSKSRVRIFARQWTFHESFTSPSVGNIGLIQLPLYAVANLNITTIAMNLLDVKTYYVGNMATAVGWGGTENTDEPPNLLYTNLRIISSAECQLSWSTSMSNIFCAKSPTTSIGQGLCYGDDGGPLIYQSLLIGIISYYDDGCDPTYPGIITPIALYNSWINQKISEAVLGKFWVVPFEGNV